MLKYCPHCGKELPQTEDQQKIKETTKKAHKESKAKKAKRPVERKEPGFFDKFSGVLNGLPGPKKGSDFEKMMFGK